MEERRTKPLYGPAGRHGRHTHGHGPAAPAARGADVGRRRRRIFIIGDAERLVAQEASPEAANALLKLLEEPPPGSLFVLTTVDAAAAAADDPVAGGAAAADRAAGRRGARSSSAGSIRARAGRQRRSTSGLPAAGSIGAALAAGEETGKAYQAARANCSRRCLPGRARALERALRQPPWSARGEFTAMLDALADTLGEAARGDLGQATRRPVPPALLRQRRSGPLLQAMERVAEAREAACGKRQSAAPARRARRGAGGGAVRLSHVDEAGRARMVDVGGQAETERTAVAEGRGADVPRGVRPGGGPAVAKGDVLDGGRGGRRHGGEADRRADPALPPAWGSTWCGSRPGWTRRSPACGSRRRQR